MKKKDYLSKEPIKYLCLILYLFIHSATCLDIDIVLGCSGLAISPHHSLLVLHVQHHLGVVEQVVEGCLDQQRVGDCIPLAARYCWLIRNFS